ncbi:pyridoxamine 5'-phosphate oxidase family protein [Streptomyces sp. NBC_00536]|uniref:pyridoxamine 5'-phosphate oxidase family protein n=1 Tax=Streptomyces sp. NBC_00536 TaxID=2975769 RepID=UPI002E81FDE5|nr:pyridoxamine 5'-phosphate oxidase family protein [Streptomyces sp. NBC_00536]WUC76964.1 pyridoxamine 5'-phosphate oxidase family protein [Streptomyces sp. NBC_00536]
MTVPADRHLIEVSGTEALWLLEGSSQGRLVYVQREIAMVRPATHVMEFGRLIVRVPVQSTAVLGRSPLTYQVDEINSPAGTGWTVTVHGPADVIGDPTEAAHHRRTLAGWTHGPHDTLLRLHPQQVSGFRLARTVSGAGR